MEVFAKEGYHSSTVGAIAKKAGISQGLMYNYFNSKEELLNNLMIGMIEVLMCEFMPINPKEKITKKHIVNFINVGIDLVLKDPKFWKLYFSVFLQQTFCHCYESDDENFRTIYEGDDEISQRIRRKRSCNNNEIFLGNNGWNPISLHD